MTFDIPQHETPPTWDRRKIKFHLSGFFGGGTPSKDNLDYWIDGAVPWVTPKDMKRRIIDTAEDFITVDAVKNSATNMVPPSSVLMVVRSGILKHSLPVALNTVPVALNQDMKAFRFRRSLLPEFFAYWIEGQQKQKLLEWCQIGATVDNINVDTMLNGQIAVPDLATQRQIADFLDRETARIDLLIEKKQRLVALLVGKKETLRDIAVCKGLSGAADMKSSGVDWFGEVPAHWTVCRFNRLIASKVDYRGRTPEKVDEGVFLVTARNIRDGKIDYLRSEEFTTAEDWEKLSARGKPRLGDVIFTTEAPLGQIAQVDRTDVAFAQRIMKFRANDALVSNDFLAEFMMTASFQRSLQLYSSGSTAAGIKSERLAHLSGLVPPKEEQQQIAAFVRREIDQLNGLEAPINTSIDRLKEYRSALITAAVTGQIDVSTYAKAGTTDRRLDSIQEEMGA